MISVLYATKVSKKHIGKQKLESRAYERELSSAEWDSLGCKVCLLWAMNYCGGGFVNRVLAP